MMGFDQVRDQLVMAALPSVAFDGWTMAVLADAARRLDLDPTMAERAFLNGPVQAVEHFTRLGDRLMVQDVADVDLAALRVPDRLCRLIQARLTRWMPEREAVRRALSLLVLPQHTATAAALGWGTADALWRAAGDTSHDFSWYTRRLTLAAVYAATMLYWLDDPSDDCADTWAFLRRRMADVGRFTQQRRSLEHWVRQVIPA